MTKTRLVLSRLSMLLIVIVLAAIAVACGSNKDDNKGGNSSGEANKPEIEVSISGGLKEMHVGDTVSFEASISNAIDGEIEWGWETVVSIDFVVDYGTFGTPTSNQTTFLATKVARGASIMVHAVYQGETYEAFYLIENIAQAPVDPEPTP